MARRPAALQMDRSLRRAEHYYTKLLVGSLVGLLLCVFLFWAGYQAYSRCQERQLIRQAHVFFDENNLEWAGLAAQKAFSWRSDSIEACRILADIAERQKLNQAIDWRRRAIEIQP